jgi:hypothetical protein
MPPKFKENDKVLFLNQESVILKVRAAEAEASYYVATGSVGLPMWIRESELKLGPAIGGPTIMFEHRVPHVLVVDDFYKDPDQVREFALNQEFAPNLQYYKGKRTHERFLWPHLREEFERLLGRPIIDWLQQSANGCFQITGFDDPLVWHSDTQSYAAAVYLTPHAPVGAGTSFWRDRTHGCRRPPRHPLEARRFASDAERNTAGAEIYTQYNVVHPENWELVDKVGGVYNRLVLWDAQLIHSASSYEGLEGTAVDKARLVHLFFFTIK